MTAWTLASSPTRPNTRSTTASSSCRGRRDPGRQGRSRRPRREPRRARPSPARCPPEQRTSQPGAIHDGASRWAAPKSPAGRIYSPHSTSPPRRRPFNLPARRRVVLPSSALAAWARDLRSAAAQRSKRAAGTFQRTTPPTLALRAGRSTTTMMRSTRCVVNDWKSQEFIEVNPELSNLKLEADEIVFLVSMA